MIVVLLGPPGAGKGTQAARLAPMAGLTHVSTGELFREHLRSGTDMGRRAREFMSRGELVPDAVVVSMVEDCLAAGGGFVLDGFPRTLAQAEALDALTIDRRLIATVIHVPSETLLTRLTGRRVCQDGRHVYNVVTSPPRTPDVCDFDGTPLLQRDDDSDAMVATRLAVYDRETAPVLAYYEATDRLLHVDGDGDSDTVNERLMEALEGAGATGLRSAVRPPDLQAGTPRPPVDVGLIGC